MASMLPLAALVFPSVGALGAIGWRIGNACAWLRALMLACSAATVLVTFSFVPLVLRGETLELQLLQLAPQTWIAFRVDAPGVLYGATAALLWLMALVFATGYLHGDHLVRIYATLMIALAAAMGLSFSANLLTFFIFYELLSVLTYVLVVHEETILSGVLLTYAFGGDLTFRAGGLFPDGVSHVTLILTFVCFALGFGVKAAVMPLHGWVPDAHPAAPAPCSALLSGVLVAAGSFGLLRVSFEVFGAGLLRELGVMPFLGGLAAMTVVVAAIKALRQDDLKRRLAYSTISQMSYVLLALSLLGPIATVGALVHIVHHAFMKGALFFCAGSFAHATGKRSMASLAGLAERAPLTAAAFTVASLGMIGFPPLSGFISKWWLGVGILESSAPYALAVLLLGALLAAGYLLPVVYALYFGVPEHGEDAEGEAPPRHDDGRPSVLLATGVAGAMTVLLGLAASATGFPVDLAQAASRALFGGP
jgi:multicomponent Na+:H+ antiporter subunit D